MSLDFRLRDLTELSPLEYRVRPRRLSEIRAVILHQTGFEWRESNRMWAKVRAHYVVHRSGLVSALHPILVRMRYGAGHANQYAINVEIEGAYALDYNDRGEGLFYKPEKFGRSVLADAPAQVEAARQLLAWLKGQVPGLQVGTHRQVALDRSGCCGPDLWAAVGQYGVDVLGMREMPVDGGRPIPDAWRGDVRPVLREYTGALGPTG